MLLEHKNAVIYGGGRGHRRCDAAATAADAGRGGERGGLHGFRSGQRDDGDRGQPVVRLTRRLADEGDARLHLGARERHVERRIPLPRPRAEGRDEAGLPFTMAWVRYHDRYGD